MQMFSIRESFRKNIIWYLIIFIFTIACCALFQKTVKNANESGSLIESNISFMDNLLYILGGIPKIKNVSEHRFQIPFIWTAIQLTILACGYMNPFCDSNLKDKMLLMKSKSRTMYIIRQMLVSILQVFMIYFCIIDGIIIYTVLNGNVFSEVHIDYFTHIFGIMIRSDINMTIIIFPVIYGVIVAIAQMFLNLYIGRMITLALILGYDILSIYITSSYLLGNISIIFRTSIVANSQINLFYGMSIGLVIMTILVLLTIKRFNKVDLL